MAFEELMKYLFLLVCFLVGCSTPRIQEPMVEFECVVLGLHGVYAHMTGKFESEKAARDSAETMRLYLVKNGKVSDTTSVFCHEVGTEE